MCALKTGCLARFAAEAGVVAAEVVKNPSSHSSFLISHFSLALADAAEKLGVGFQILDDVKNLTVGIPGKKRGDDIAEGKKSLPVLLFVHRRPEMKGTVCRCFNAARSGGAGIPETEELIQALSAEGVLAEAEDQGKALIAQARKVFAETGNAENGAAAGLLAGLTDLLI
jgi:octaprenyl-diphosphate synthase